MIDYHALAPDLIMAGTVLVVLVVDIFTRHDRKYLTALTAMAGIVVASFPLVTLGFSEVGARTMLDGSYVVDEFAIALKAFFLFVAFVTVLLSFSYIEGDRYYQGEFYFLLLSSILGAMLMASARDMVTMFVALELVSGPAFLMAGWRKGDARSSEAALKMFIIGVLSAAVFLFGMSLIYGATSSVLFADIAAVLSAADAAIRPAIILGVLFILVGFGFKVSAVPFHFWAPDTYEGAPTPVTAYLSVGSKAAGFIGLLTMLYQAFRPVADIWGPAIWIIAIASMTLGNLVALRQENIVRLLAYSSISHAGFMLVPFAMAWVYDDAGLDQAFSATITYLIIYGIMNLGAFGLVIAASRRVGSGNVTDWNGLGQYAPDLAILLTIFMFSLAGVPPFAGWFAKFEMFRSVANAFSGSDGAVWAAVLAGAAAINAVIAFFYYARLVVAAWFLPVKEGFVPRTVSVAPSLAFALSISAVAVMVIGVLPWLVSEVSQFSTLVAGG